MSPPNVPLESDLIRSAVTYCRLTAGEPPVRITLTLATGGRRSLSIPGAGLAFAGERNLEVWPPTSGWGFRPGEAAYEGATFPIHGKAGAVLRALADKPGGVATAELKRVVWEDSFTEDRTVQNTVSQLRATIRRGLGLAQEVDPICAESGVYRLVMP